MSKEDQNNTPYKSSVILPNENVEVTQENKTTPLQSSINTPIKPLENPQEVKNPEVLFPKDELKPLPDVKKQPEQQQEKKVLVDSKRMFALRAATLGAAGVAFVAKGAGVVVKALNKDVTSVKEAGEAFSALGGGVAKAFGPADKLFEQKGKIKEEGPPTPGLYDKSLDKIKTLPGGKVVVNIIDKTFKTLTSKSVLRAAKIGGAVVSAVTTPPPVGIVIGTLSLVSIIANVAKETFEVREAHHLDREKKSLENIKENKQQQLKEVINAKEELAKNSPNLQKFLDTKIPEIYKNPPVPSADKPFKGSKTKEVFKAIASSSLENAALVIEGFGSGGIIGGVAAIATGAVNIGSESEANLVRRKQKNDKINKINNLKLTTENYENHKKLQALERQEQINNTALKEFLKETPNIDKLNQIQLEAAFATKEKEVGKRKEFEQLPEKTRYQKVKSAVKTGAGYFVESQFGDLVELYSSDKEKTQNMSSVTSKAKPEPDKTKSNEVVKEKVKEKFTHMQESLTHGQVSMKTRISAPAITPVALGHNKSHDSSRG